MKNLASFVFNNNSANESHICCIEELSELQQAITKMIRGRSHNIVEEMAHVLLMIEVLKIGMEIDNSEIYQEARKAVERMASKKGILLKL